MYIDTHTHLYDADTTDLQEEAIERAIAAGVTKLYMPNCASETIAPMMALAQKYPHHCFPMMGLHPCYVKENYLQELAVMAQHLATGTFAAVGEIGLDFHWDKTFVKEQYLAFEQQIDWAIEYKLPIVIHARSATEECIQVVKKKQKGDLVSIFHCFSGSAQQAHQIADLGGYLGIGGVVTYKNSALPEMLKTIDLAHIVLETDAPYLAPVPYRGKRNESAYIPIIAARLAEIYELSIEELAAQTSSNAEKIFSIPSIK